MNDSSYWTLHEQGVAALHGARLAEAEAAFLSAHREAKRRRCFALADRAYCNWAAVQVEKGLLAGTCEGLSKVLGRSQDLKARRLAAYYLAICYYARNLPKPAKFYAEMSSRLAQSLGDRRAQASSHHLMGILCMGENHLGSARKNLEASLAIQVKEGASLHTAMTTSTLAYCLSLMGDRREGAWLLEETLSEMESASSRVYEPHIRLNLGFASLEWGDLDGALEQGKAALAAVEEHEPSHEGKFARYLLGEAHVQTGADQEAEEQFEVLEKTYYPQYPGLSGLLLSCRTSQFLNWLGP